MGDRRKARAAMAKAFEINPKMKGVRRICEKLGIKEPASSVAGRQPTGVK